MVGRCVLPETDDDERSVPSPAKRRRVGLLLIIGVLLAAVVVPKVGIRAVPGTPQALPVTGPPSVGDCVADPIDPSWDNPAVAANATGTTGAAYAYPRLDLKPCQGSRYGEVTAVITTSAEPVISISSDGTFANDSNVENCSPTASEYVGIAMTGTQRAPLIAPWYPSQIVEAAASTPPVRQTAAGQHWLACIVYLGASQENPHGIAGQERYDGPLRKAMSTGAQRDRIGTCAVGTDLTGGQLGLVGCGITHLSEIFAQGGSGTDSRTRAGLQNSCAQVVARLTRIPDITAAGLTVQVLAISSNSSPITDALIPAEVNLSCGVTAEHQRPLDGSLLALGNAPIPWVK